MMLKGLNVALALVTVGALTNEMSAETILVTDREVVYVDHDSKLEIRPIPADALFLEVPQIEALPRGVEVPFAWERENVYMGHRGRLTDNVYREPERPWILQLAISTPGKGDTRSGSPQYKVWYRVSNDDGKTYSDLKQVVVAGEAYSVLHPIDGVEVGRNGFNVDATRPIVRASNGEIMVPVCLHPWDEEKQEIYNPANAYIYQDTGVLIGKWNEDGSDILWEFGEWNRLDHQLSTRGLSEPTIVELEQPGHFAMVCRGSNLRRPDLPGHAWVSFSDDYCRSWSTARPMAYSDGEPFFVPAAHSTLIRSRQSGRLYWIGNLLPENPDGNHPRHPLVIAEVDESNFGLIRDSVVELDRRDPEREDWEMQLSNFSVMEHRESGELLVTLTRRVGRTSAPGSSWYRIVLPETLAAEQWLSQ